MMGIEKRIADEAKMAKTKITILCILGAFITYCSMYAFRKPFTAAMFEGLVLWGLDYKIILVITQVLGYMLSKFVGIKLVSEMPAKKRILSILALIGISWASLFLFAVVPYPFNFVFLFFNGLPLGMIWGIVFAFLEGRRNTELLGAAMSVSFVVASGLVKGIGRYLIDAIGVSEFWMPFVTGLLFVPPLFLGVFLLHKVPPPDANDIAHRTERVPMDKQQRWAFFNSFSVGIILMVAIYVALTIFRDLRDNFAVELWTLLGYGDVPRALVLSEIPIAIAVFLVIGFMMYIKKNGAAFYANLAIILIGGFLLVLSTFMFKADMLSPVYWMVLAGFAMYLSYISYHTMLFERWIALFRYKSNIGFLMYLADAFGYLGSVGILFYKNFGSKDVDWLSFILSVSYVVGITTIFFVLIAFLYFKKRERTVKYIDRLQPFDAHTLNGKKT